MVERGTGCVIRDARNQKITGPKVPHRQTAPLDEQEFYDHARSYGIERDVSWMYQDAKGNVTVGIGHLLLTEEDAVALAASFQDKNDPAAPVSTEAIRAAHSAVKQAPLKGAIANYYEPLTTLRLRSNEGSEIFFRDMSRILRELQAHAPYSQYQFETFPPDAKFAIMYMAFTLGQRASPSANRISRARFASATGLSPQKNRAGTFKRNETKIRASA